MRLLQLLHDGDFSFADHSSNVKTPKYAILSHTWGEDKQEVTFDDITKNIGKEKTGYKKLQFCGKQVLHDKLKHLWVDTCCIDKSNSTELSTAINSMFRWYRDAAKCYVFLSDVSFRGRDGAQSQTWLQQFKNSRWFTRGWTLQELLAPKSVEFFSIEGDCLGDKHSLIQEIQNMTGISILALKGDPLFQFSKDQKMSWAFGRETKQEEDAAYCLMGLFDIHMPLIYGEGRENALKRLEMVIQSFIYYPSSPKVRRSKKRNPLKSKVTLSNLDVRLPFQTFRDPSRRYLIRFHEALVLLYTLGGSTGDQEGAALHLEDDIPSLPPRASRRKFLTDVAYICDYDSDGTTATAIGLEATSLQPVFWVASSSSPEKMIISFIKSLFAIISENSNPMKLSSSSVAARGVFEKCMQFANSQIEACKRALFVSLEICLEQLDTTIRDEALGLVEWLRSWFRQDSPTAMCYFAYKNLRSKFMHTLASLNERAFGGTEDGTRNSFELCIYYIQRLARYHLAATAILSCGQRLPELRGNYRVESIATPPEASLPPFDVSTKLDSIALRMHPTSSPHLERCQQALRGMDARNQVFTHFQNNYISPQVKPHVHPEVQVLEWFHRENRLFVADDPFIASSKPSCLCCQLYFRYHPGDFVEPFSDRKICLSWRPHHLDTEEGSPMSEHQQQKILLDAMAKDIRKYALRHIDKETVPKAKHSDIMINTIKYDSVPQAQKFSAQARSLTVPFEACLDLDSISLGGRGVSMTSAPRSECKLLPSTNDVGIASGGNYRDERTNSFGQIPSAFNYFVDDSDEEGGILI